MREIQAEYDKLTADALAAWSAHPDSGHALAADPDRGRLGVTSGRLIPFNAGLLALHAQLSALGHSDPALAVVPRDSLHFTFLALAWDQFDGPHALPTALADLKPVFQGHVRGLNWAVTNLRLVPLRNGLVLAGMPNMAAYGVRLRLTQALLDTAWRPWLEARYAGLPLPPRLWHTTLARYGRDYAPQALRELYFAHAGRDLGAIELGEPELLMTDSTWTVRLPL